MRYLIIIDYLKENAVGIENAIKSKKLEELFNISASNLRYDLAKAKRNQKLVIGSNINGYFIPRENEVKEATKSNENKAISHIANAVHQRPAFALRVYKELNKLLKEIPQEAQKQLTLKIDKEMEVNYYAKTSK